MSNRLNRRKQMFENRGMLPSIHPIPDGSLADDALTDATSEPVEVARHEAPTDPVEPMRRFTALLVKAVPRGLPKAARPKQPPPRPVRPHTSRNQN